MAFCYLGSILLHIFKIHSKLAAFPKNNRCFIFDSCALDSAGLGTDYYIKSNTNYNLYNIF